MFSKYTRESGHEITTNTHQEVRLEKSLVQVSAHSSLLNDIIEERQQRLRVEICRNKMMEGGRKCSFSSFIMTLMVCWTTSATVSSFQPTLATTPVSVSTYQLGVGGGARRSHDIVCLSRRRAFDRDLSPIVNSRLPTHIFSSVTAASTGVTPMTQDEDDNGEEDWGYLSSEHMQSDKTRDEEYQRRKQEWAGRYTSVEALREAFGTNRNKLWGDLQAGTARRLYKTLLPRALLELGKVGAMQPQDLAPLAYQARVAAKLYARERCTVPARLAATLFDGFRQWRRYGKFQTHGLTYDQLWEKYSKAIIQETELSGADNVASTRVDIGTLLEKQGHSQVVTDPDLSSVDKQVAQRILESSCKTNEKVDELCLKGRTQKDQKDVLEQVHAQLQEDVYQLLLPSVKNNDMWSPESLAHASSIQHFRTLRMLVRAKQKFLKSQQQQQPPRLREVTVPVHQPWNDRPSKTSNRSRRWSQRPKLWASRRGTE